MSDESNEMSEFGCDLKMQRLNENAEFALCQGTISRAVDRFLTKALDKRQFLEEEDRDYWINEAWLYWLSPRGEKMRRESAEDNRTLKHQTKYQVKSIRNRLCKRLQRMNARSIGYVYLDDKMLDNLAPSPIEATMHRAIAKATPDLQNYLLEQSRDDLQSNECLKKAYGWSRSLFASIQEQAKEWAIENYPDDCRRYLRPLLEAQLVLNQAPKGDSVRDSAWEMMEDLYRSNSRKNEHCSVLFAPDDADPVLWGPLAEAIGETLGRHPNPGALVQVVRIGWDEIEKLDRHFPNSPAADAPPAWMYSNFAFSEQMA